MWRIGHVCIHSGPAEESYCPRVHRQHRGRGRRNRSRSMLSMKLLDPLPFTPFLSSLCGSSIPSSFGLSWAQFVSFGQSQVKVLLEAVARQKEAEAQMEEPTRRKTPKDLATDRNEWRTNEEGCVVQLWVSVQSVCRSLGFLWDALTQCYHMISALLLCPQMRSPRMCLTFFVGASQRVFQSRGGEHDGFVLICPCVLLMQDTLANLAATKHDLQAAARGPIPVRLVFLLVEGGFMEQLWCVQKDHEWNNDMNINAYWILYCREFPRFPTWLPWTNALTFRYSQHVFGV